VSMSWVVIFYNCSMYLIARFAKRARFGIPENSAYPALVVRSEGSALIPNLKHDPV
jgi:hypothetical protein